MERQRIRLEQHINKLLVALALALNGCTTTPTPPLPTESLQKPALTEALPSQEKPSQEKPIIIICHVDDPNYPTAIRMIAIQTTDKGNLLFIDQIFQGSEAFKPNPDGSLNPVTIKGNNLIPTGINAEITLPDVKINIIGCLVDEKDLPNLQKLLTPDSQNGIQGLNLSSPRRPEKNPFKGNLLMRRQMRSSKPQGFHHF